MINLEELLTARQAADRLGVKLDTLYAYVSRGRLKAVAVPGTREKRYPAAAVAALRQRSGRIATPAPGAPDPVLFEQAAALLWQTDAAGLPELPAQPGFVARVAMRLAAAAAADPGADDLGSAAALHSGRNILGVLRVAAAGPEAAAGPAHLGLAAGWDLDSVGAELLRRCLTASLEPRPDAAVAVAAAVAAARASPYAVIAAAMAALAGGGAGSAAAADLFAELALAGGPAVAVMAQRLARGAALPGFGHPLYPEGDPRATALLEALATGWPAAARQATAAADAGIRLTGQRPNLDFALAAIAAALRLPADAALALDVIGRAVGWLALAIAQYDGGR